VTHRLKRPPPAITYILSNPSTLLYLSTVSAVPMQSLLARIMHTLQSIGIRVIYCDLLDTIYLILAPFAKVSSGIHPRRRRREIVI